MYFCNSVIFLFELNVLIFEVRCFAPSPPNGSEIYCAHESSVGLAQDRPAFFLRYRRINYQNGTSSPSLLVEAAAAL